MLNIILPILSVLLGFFVVVVLKPSQRKNLKLLLAFSGSFLLSITVFDFLPEVYQNNDKSIGLFIMIGILLQIIANNSNERNPNRYYMLEFLKQKISEGAVQADRGEPRVPRRREGRRRAPLPGDPGRGGQGGPP